MSNQSRHLIHKNSGKVMDVDRASLSNGGSISVFQLHGGENQSFFVDTEIGWIINVFSRKAVTATQNMKKVVQQDYCGLSSQQWPFEETQ